MKEMENFQEKVESFSNKFEEIIEKDFNITLHKIDDLINSAKNLREYYIKTYKEKMGRYIQTLSFLKIFYLNFYKDREVYTNIVQPEKNNIYTLIYLNSISHELDSMKITHLIGFKLYDSFQAHQKFIGGLILTHNNNRIMTSSKDYTLKVWDPKEDKKKVQEEASKKIINLLGLKNGKILASRDKDILIYELNEKKKYFNSQSLSRHNELVWHHNFWL